MLLADLLPNIAVTDLGSHTSHLPLSALMKLLLRGLSVTLIGVLVACDEEQAEWMGIQSGEC